MHHLNAQNRCTFMHRVSLRVVAQMVRRRQEGKQSQCLGRKSTDAPIGVGASKVAATSLESPTIIGASLDKQMCGQVKRLLTKRLKWTVYA